MLTIHGLRQFGANVEEGINRCMNDEEFYLELVEMALEDESFEKLSEAVKAKKWRDAFEAAHALKGVLANVALTPLYTQVSEMTELLRAEKDADYPTILGQILRLRDTLLIQKNS